MKKSILQTFLWDKIDVDRDQQFGDECFIFGDGPSVGYYDLADFSYLPSIYCGLLPFHKSFNQLNPVAATLVEPYFFLPPVFQPKISSLIGTSILRDAYLQELRRQKNVISFWHFTNTFMASGLDVRIVSRFSKIRPATNITRLLNQLGPFSGSFFAVISAAIYMGFKKLNFIGFDGWLFEEGVKGHWYENKVTHQRFKPFPKGSDKAFANRLFSSLAQDFDVCTFTPYKVNTFIKGKNYFDFFSRAHRCIQSNQKLLQVDKIPLLQTYSGFTI